MIAPAAVAVREQEALVNSTRRRRTIAFALNRQCGDGSDNLRLYHVTDGSLGTKIYRVVAQPKFNSSTTGATVVRSYRHSLPSPPPHTRLCSERM